VLSLGDGGDQQIGEVGGSDLSAAPQRGLDVQRPPPVLIVGGEPFIAEVPGRVACAARAFGRDIGALTHAGLL